MDEKDTNRLEAFSDGVFAVAITLLVLDIKFNPFDAKGVLWNDSALWGEIFSQWPTLLAFVTSFFTIGVMWLNHHRVFKHIKHSDTMLLFLNILLLMIIVFIPVPTSLLAEYVIHPDYHAAAILYSATFLAMATCFNIIWRYASYKGRLLGTNVDVAGVNKISRQYVFGPLVYVVALGIAWFNTPLTIVFSLLLAIFFALPDISFRRRGGDQDSIKDEEPAEEMV
ncbi:TMEM175 family protein [Dictyobacter kobayashii]|uniref:DUF1211 domain-containing membrane protein n=1 Tax=Dictyobacter kobayashii TaxID=2014872 RepID=A0A402AUW7_9CHLR|nr:TMEM175 family protein [Dictyobacter kobayashii]GCE22916.1 DUF1211 domain-containing membrane protein [Dictyobacter kobayashii]